MDRCSVCCGPLGHTFKTFGTSEGEREVCWTCSHNFHIDWDMEKCNTRGRVLRALLPSRVLMWVTIYLDNYYWRCARKNNDRHGILEPWMDYL